MIIAAYRRFEGRGAAFGGRGSKGEAVRHFIRSSLSDEFTIADICRAARLTQATDHQQGVIAGTLGMIGGPGPGHRRLRRTSIRVVAAARAVATTTTDKRGRFRIALPAGRCQLALTNGSGRLTPTHLDVAASGTTRVTLTLSVK